MIEYLARGWGETFERTSKYMEHNLKHLKLITKMESEVNLKTFKPSRKAMDTLNVIFSNKMAWKFAGKKFRNQLLG